MPIADLPASLEAARDGAVVILKLNRPAKRNALDDDTIEGLRAYFAALPSDARAVVVHGAGTHFCAGLDLGEIAGEPDILRSIKHSRMWHRAFDEIQFAPVPVFAALHGAVVGGGLELASAAHVRIADETAYYALPEGQRGIFVGGGGSVRIPRLVGVALMQDMMLTGRTISAREGLSFGFSQYVVDGGTAFAKALELAHKASGNAAATNFAVLHVLPQIAESSPQAGYLTEALMASIADTHPDAQERLRAFLEKRAAKIIHRD